MYSLNVCFLHLPKNGSKGEKGEIGPPGQAVSMVIYQTQLIFTFKYFAASQLWVLKQRQTAT